MEKYQAIKEYLHGSMTAYDLIVYIDSEQNKSVKNDGVIYTPKYIADEMIRISNINLDTKIIEPSCGHGIFLLSLIEYMNKNYNLQGDQLKSWFLNNVIALEISSATVNDTKLILEAFFEKEFNVSVKYSDFMNIICTDALTYDFDTSNYTALGNPPYIRTKNLEENYLKFLKKNFNSCKKGNIDIYFAFLEKYTKCKSSCFIVPNSFLSNKSGSTLRKIISPKLEYLIDFKDKKVFKDASVYTCIVKTGNSGQEKFVYCNDIGNPVESKITSLFFSESQVNKTIEKLYSGIATLSDKLFKVNQNNDGTFFATYNNTTYPIDNNLVVPYLKLTKIKNTCFTSEFIIFPYNLDNKIVPENELSVRYPNTYKYLKAIKNELCKRDKGKIHNYDAWYAYGRRQGLNIIQEDDLLIIPAMIGNECNPVCISVKKLKEKFNRFVFTSGFILPINSNTKALSENILTSCFLDYVKSTGKKYPGNYFSINSTIVKKFITSNQTSPLDKFFE